MAGDLLVTEKGEGRRSWYYYDSAANPVSMRVSGKDYFYVRNPQNDVIALIDDAGETVVEYKYNSWGKILIITGSKASTIGKTNPFRYRGYYYDEETGMYYLKTGIMIRRSGDLSVRIRIFPDLTAQCAMYSVIVEIIRYLIATQRELSLKR